MDALNTAVWEVRRAAKKAGLKDEALNDLEIVIREAVVNAVEHGSIPAAADRVFLRCYAGPDGVLIAVRDWGNGFDPQDVPDPRNEDRIHLSHGRGLLMMRSLMDFAEHRHGGREIVLYKSVDDA